MKYPETLATAIDQLLEKSLPWLFSDLECSAELPITVDVETRRLADKIAGIYHSCFNDNGFANPSKMNAQQLAFWGFWTNDYFDRVKTSELLDKARQAIGIQAIN